MIKIVYIHHGSVIGGAPTSLKNLVNGVNQSENVSCTIACAQTSMLSFFQELENVKVKQYTRTSLSAGRWFIWGGINRVLLKATVKDIIFLPLYLTKEIKFLKHEKPDIVHLNSSILWTSALACWLMKIPFIWHDRETFEGGRYNLRRLLYSWFMKKIASRVICIGPQEYRQIGGDKSNNVSMIYNSLDNTYFEQRESDKIKIRKVLNIPEKKFIYLSLGGNSFRKGGYQLIKSIDYLDMDCCCIIAGQPIVMTNIEIPERIKQKLIKEDQRFSEGKINYLSEYYHIRLDLSLRNIDDSKLIMTGLIDDVKEYINSCDVLIFAGTTPHSARPVYEAWALKKPVIVFDTEVMRIDVEDGVDGIIVKKHTAEALADAIRELKSNPGLAKQMGENGYKKALERFSLKRNTEKILEVYREILGEDSL